MFVVDGYCGDWSLFWLLLWWWAGFLQGLDGGHGGCADQCPHRGNSRLGGGGDDRCGGHIEKNKLQK